MESKLPSRKLSNCKFLRSESRNPVARLRFDSRPCCKRHPSQPWPDLTQDSRARKLQTKCNMQVAAFEISSAGPSTFASHVSYLHDVLANAHNVDQLRSCDVCYVSERYIM